MDKNERINNEQEMPAETKKNHSADADRVKEVYKVTIAGSIINVVLLVLKFAAGILGHSAAMIADAIHSLTDFATDVVVLVFVKLGNKPKDKDHDYGHGKYETLATAIIGISLFVVGVMICYSGVTKIRAERARVRIPDCGSNISRAPDCSMMITRWYIYRTKERPW